MRNLSGIVRVCFAFLFIILCSSCSIVTDDSDNHGIGDKNVKVLDNGMEELPVIPYSNLAKKLSIRWPSARYSDGNAILNVAVLAPFSGANASLGRSVIDAVKLALVAENNTLAKYIRVIPLDTGDDLGKLDEIFDQLDSYKIDVIIGPVFANQARMLHSYLLGRNIPIFTLSNDISLSDKENLYILGVIPSDQMNQLLKQWWEVSNYSRYGMRRRKLTLHSILQDDRYGQDLERGIKKSSELYGYDSFVYRYNYGSENALHELDKIMKDIAVSIKLNGQCKGDGMVGVFVPEGDWKVVKMYNYLENDVDLNGCTVFLGLDNWADDVQVGVGSSVFIERRYSRYFLDNFRTTYGYDASVLPALAYDAMLIVFRTMEWNDYAKKWNLYDVTRPKGYEGVMGNVVLLASGASVRSCYFDDFLEKNNKKLV